MSRPGLVDAAGITHPRAGATPRIVSLVPSLTELVFELGLGERLVGRTGFCVHPKPAVDAIAKVGGTKTVRLDRLRALAPTHVLVNVDENRIEDVEAMRAFVPHVVATHPIEPADNVALYGLVGGLFGVEARAGVLAAEFHRALARLRTTTGHLPPQRVLYLIWRDPWMTVSRDTYISRMLALVGWETVGHDPGVRYPTIEPDGGLFREADLILLSSEPFPFKAHHATEVRAVAGGTDAPPVALIDAEMISWYGSRAIPGLDYLARFACRQPEGGAPSNATRVPPTGPRPPG